MSKKKVNLKYTKVTLPEGANIIEQFENYLKTHGKKVSDIIGFLSIQNARISSALTAGNGELPKSVKEDIYEFYEYFAPKYGGITYDARMENWGGSEPLIFRVAEMYYEELLYKEQKEDLKVLNDYIRKEAESLANVIWNIREDKELSFTLADEKGDIVPDTLYIDKTIPKKKLDMVYTFLLYDCAVMLMSYGAVVVRVIKEDTTEIFGIRTSADNRWLPVSKEEMLDAHTLCPDGTRLDPEDGVVYTEITKK